MYVAVKGGEKAIAPLTPYRNRNDGAMDGFPN
jgi:alpha-D-ribose 1-methylphosphonate 5-triphosphate synthase subunit PhnI